jgi:hypothetical protein
MTSFMRNCNVCVLILGISFEEVNNTFSIYLNSAPKVTQIRKNNGMWRTSDSKNHNFCTISLICVGEMTLEWTDIRNSNLGSEFFIWGFQKHQLPWILLIISCIHIFTSSNVFWEEFILVRQTWPEDILHYSKNLHNFCLKSRHGLAN